MDILLDTPEDVLVRAFEALARGEFARVLELLDPVTISQARHARARVLSSIERQDDNAAKQYARALTERFGLPTAEEFAGISDNEVMLRGLQSLPPARKTVTCDPIGTKFVDESTAVVTFRLVWQGLTPSDAPIREATLHRAGDTWLIKASQLSPWALPGFENIVFADPDGPQ